MIYIKDSVRAVCFLFLPMLGATFGCEDKTNNVEAGAQGGVPVRLVDQKKPLSPAPLSQKLLYRAAMAHGLQLGGEAESLILQYRETLLGNLFLEHYVSSRVVVTMEEIRDQYVANRSAYQRQSDQVRVLNFLFPGVDEATSVKVALLKYDAGVRSSLLEQHGVVPTTLSPGDMPASLDALLFGPSRPRGVLGPVGTPFGLHVLEVLEFFPKNSFRGLDEVYDEISQSLYRSKRKTLYDHLLDSLGGAYPSVGIHSK